MNLSTSTLVFLISCLIWAIPLKSQDFEVAPVLVAFDANPGEIQTQKLTIRNHGNTEQRFSLNLSDYKIKEDGSKESVEPGSTDRSLADWITINPSFVDLKPNEESSAELIMRVPRTGFKTRWGMVHVEVAKEQLPSDADKQLATGVVLVPRIVVLVKQSPRSNQNYSGHVSGLKEIQAKGNAYRSFEAYLENTGDKILDAKVFLALANMDIVEPVFQGRGIGKELITQTLEFCRHKRYPKIYLWTFKGLEAARRVYETVNFRLSEEHEVAQWGRNIKEQKYELFF